MTNLTNVRTVTSSARQYHFRDHGPPIRRLRPDAISEYEFLLRSRRAARGRRHGRGPYTVENIDAFNLDRFASVGNLKVVADLVRSNGGKAPGIDRIRFDQLTNSDIYEGLRLLSTLILNEDYNSRENRYVDIDKPGGGTRRLAIANLLDRLAFKALQCCLDPFWSDRLPRYGKSNWDAIKAMSIQAEAGAYFLTSDDIRQCFDFIRLSDVMRYHRQHISRPSLLRLIETCLPSQDGQGRPIGLPQGNAYSPIATELVLHEGLDRRLDAVGEINAFLQRYVDNIVILSRDDSEGQQTLQLVKELLTDLALSLKGEDGPTIDLREQNDRCVLGVCMQVRSGITHFSLPTSFFDRLKESLDKCWSKQDLNPIENARVVLEGKFDAFGMTFTNEAELEPTLVQVRNCLEETGFDGYSIEYLRRIAVEAAMRWRVFYYA